MGTCGLPERLLTDRVTIRKPVQSFVSGTRRPVFEFQVIATGVQSRIIPLRTALSRNVLGQTAVKGIQLFLNPTEIAENYEVVRESDGKVFVVKEVKNFFSWHLEAIVEEKAA